MAPVSKTLRGEGSGEESSSPGRSAASKTKSKKGFIDEDYHGYFVENGEVRKFTTYRGVRYVHPQHIVVRKCLTTTGSVFQPEE